ncbi:preprotein translocase subunit SecE [Capillimicrobium parvum]|uniref:Protein translocase subunit SecE n=1 Tax=Capillimicrobium parvum TaxID=2884022 RepID=A0A9E7C318_9ACTN|nr:preprotein translocase subunit SecE [Capillimicrobium parvum]UGS38294.1 Protein translocase subunit SecE [Capillimicrobium parvum]
MARRRERAKDKKLRRENVPGELEHASGEVDEVEASIVAGAEGEESSVDDAELAAEAEEAGAEAAQRESARGGRASRRDRQRDTGPKPQGNRVLNFLRASWAELQRVQWPDRKQVAQATAVVLGFVALAGAYLGVADWAAQRVVDFII